jgi:hypothetical protein
MQLCKSVIPDSGHCQSQASRRCLHQVVNSPRTIFLLDQIGELAIARPLPGPRVPGANTIAAIVRLPFAFFDRVWHEAPTYITGAMIAVIDLWKTLYWLLPITELAARLFGMSPSVSHT